MTTDVTARLAAIEQRANAATEGPWLAVGAAIARAGTRHPLGSTQGHADRQFIVHARVDVPWLIGLLRSTLRSTVEALEVAGCQFWACDGADVEPVHMKTCHVCWTLRELRAFRRALDGEVSS